MTLRVPGGCRSRRAASHAARDLREGGRPRCLPPAPRRGRPRQRSRASRAAAAGCPRASSRSRCTTSRRSGSTSGSPRSPGARRRSPCWRPGTRRRSTATRCEFQMAHRRHDRQGARLPGRAFPRRRRRADRTRSNARCGRGRRPLAVRVPATFALTGDKRTTLGARASTISRCARAGAAAGDRAARRRAVRRDRRRPRRLHDVPGVRRRVSRKARSSTTRRRRSCASSRRSACSAASARSTCPEHAITLVPRLDLTPAAQAAARAERGRGRRLHALRQAARHRKDDRRRCWRGSPAIRCSRRPARSIGCGCAPTAASSIS